MSYANAYAPTAETQSGRPRSQPPRSKYCDEERSGRRYRASGRGYDDREDDDRPYDREIVETERDRDPARPYDPRRQESYATSRSYNDPYGPGAVTQHRRSQNDLADYQSRRSRSRGRRDRDRNRNRSYSGSRSRSRSHSGIRSKLDEHFDTSVEGLGVGLAGAVVGGSAGREFGHKHKNRDTLLGALIAGLGANAAENKWHWREDNKERLEKEEDRREQKWNGRRRSSMR